VPETLTNTNESPFGSRFFWIQGKVEARHDEQY